MPKEKKIGKTNELNLIARAGHDFMILYIDVHEIIWGL
jgi:hypothetical protein